MYQRPGGSRTQQQGTLVEGDESPLPRRCLSGSHLLGQRTTLHIC